MGLRINTNISALAAQRYLSINHGGLSSTLEKLASGSRINRAGDDAAGLAISEKLKSQIRSMKQATRNSQDGIALIQVAEGAMNEVSNILIRLRELSIQAASDTIGDTERSFIDKEVQGLTSEIDRIARSTTFNGTKLLDGTGGQLEVQVGTGNDAILDRILYDSTLNNVTGESLGVNIVNTRDKASAQQNLAIVDVALGKLNENRANLGALQNRMQSTINNLLIYTENLSAANSRIRDADMAEETSNLTKQSILTQANISVLSQANMTPQSALKLLS